MARMTLVSVVYGAKLDDHPRLDDIDLDGLLSQIPNTRDYYYEKVSEMLEDRGSFTDDDLLEVLTEAGFSAGCGFARSGGDDGDLFAYSKRVLHEHDAARFSSAILDMPTDTDYHLKKKLREFLEALGIEYNETGDVGWYLLSDCI